MEDTRLTCQLAEELQDASISKFPFIDTTLQERD
jgi:hypothetical protein